MKSEETENVLLVEKRENKQLKQRQFELESTVKTLSDKIMSSSSIDAQLQLQIEENNKLKVVFLNIFKNLINLSRTTMYAWSKR